MNGRFDYFYLPKKYHRFHDYSEFVIYQIEELITSDNFVSLRQQTTNLTETQSKELKQYKGHVFDFLTENNMAEELNHVVGCHLLNSLIMETCYFLQEGYMCSLKKRLTVAFALFRKPFFEILIIQLRLLCEEDFLTRFSNEEDFNPIMLEKSKKKLYLEAVNNALQNLYITSELFDYLFDKSFADNIYNLGNLAVHLYTGNNPVIKTQKQNLNFIFSGKKEIESQWEYIYTVMPMLLTFLADLTDLNILKYTTVDAALVSQRFSDRYKMKKKYRIQ